MTEQYEQRSEDEVLAEQEADAVEDLDVTDQSGADVSGGAWPKKDDGSSVSDADHVTPEEQAQLED